MSELVQVEKEALEGLRGIAQLTNTYLGDGCCEEHEAQTLKRLYEALDLFTDDSFTELEKPSVK